MGETVDASGAVLGRLAATLAQRLQDGDEVTVVNAEQAVVSGDPETVFDRYRGKREAGTLESGPRFPEAPDRILRRTIRGMLPDGAAGRDALDRVTVYAGNPRDLDAAPLDVKNVDDLKHRAHVTVQEISENI